MIDAERLLLLSTEAPRAYSGDVLTDTVDEMRWHDLDMYTAAMAAAQRLEPWVGIETPGDPTIAESIEAQQRVERLLDEAAFVKSLLPIEIQNAAADFAKYGNEDGIFYLKGFLPCTRKMVDLPSDGLFPDEQLEGRALAVMLTAIALAFGQPFNYENNPSGAANKFLTMAMVKESESYGIRTDSELHAHRELTRAKNAPDMLLLACISEGNEDSLTFLFTPERVMAELSDETIAILSQPHFYTPDALVPESEGVPHRILYKGEDGRWVVSYALGITELASPNPQAQAALKRLDEVMQDPSVARYVHLTRGDVAIIDSRGQHGRTRIYNLWRRLCRLLISRTADRPFVMPVLDEA